MELAGVSSSIRNLLLCTELAESVVVKAIDEPAQCFFDSCFRGVKHARLVHVLMHSWVMLGQKMSLSFLAKW